MNYVTDFGQFISEKRKKLLLQSSELALKLGISTGYLSQLEHGKRLCPDPKLLEKMADVLRLDRDEREIFYDLYAKASGQLSPDIVEYIQSNGIIKKALRAARDADATDTDWERFISSLKK